jgi:hypothetical protein
MATILHISDTHAQAETLKRVDTLARRRKDVDVVAFTGDCASKLRQTVPQAWDTWPQSTKLAVPGNHCLDISYAHLHSWITSPPFLRIAEGILFVGLNTAEGWAGGVNQLETLGSPSEPYGAVAVLSHRRPSSSELEPAASALARFVNRRPVLLMHGHDHPAPFEDPEWEDGFLLGDLRSCRSKVITSARTRRGVGAVIRWEGSRFMLLGYAGGAE